MTGPANSTVPGSGTLEDGAPMRRYVFPITPGKPEAARDPAMIQILEALNSQTQLLIDLIASVNCLTSAILCREK